MKNLWNDLLDSIKQKINRQNYEIWFSQIKFHKFENKEIHLEVPNRYFHDWIRDNYQDLIHSEIQNLTGEQFKLVFSYAEKPQENSDTIKKPQENITDSNNNQNYEKPSSQFRLNPDKKFETFVVGSSNQFAHAAAIAVAENPAQTYNPLFLFGTVGLGKTHLLNAIGNKLLENKPSSRIIYISSEQFVNELINSIRAEKMNEFRNKFRDTCDALLVDDIQFLAGKLRTQEEFFYTFNALHSSGRQIVVTSDKFPKEIQGLEERLRNRFEWGLIADIQPPDLETKVAILTKKSALEKIYLPNEVAIYIASNVKSNIRELEGILIRLNASAAFYGRKVDLNFAQETLKQLIETTKPSLTIDFILEIVCKYFDLKISEIKSHKKNKELVGPRQIAMFLSRQHTTCSFPEIGQKVGGRDHTTVIHAVKKIDENLKLNKDLKLQQDIKAIEKNLGI